MIVWAEGPAATSFAKFELRKVSVSVVFVSALTVPISAGAIWWVCGRAATKVAKLAVKLGPGIVLIVSVVAVRLEIVPTLVPSIWISCPTA